MRVQDSVHAKARRSHCARWSRCQYRSGSGSEFCGLGSRVVGFFGMLELPLKYISAFPGGENCCVQVSEHPKVYGLEGFGLLGSKWAPHVCRALLARVHGPGSKSVICIFRKVCRLHHDLSNPSAGAEDSADIAQGFVRAGMHGDFGQHLP